MWKIILVIGGIVVIIGLVGIGVLILGAIGHYLRGEPWP